MNPSFRLLVPGLIKFIACLVVYVSYTQTPSDAFIFPQVVSTLWLILALCDRTHVAGMTQAAFLNLLPGLGICIVYVFWAIDFLGFYTSTAPALFGLITLYDPAPHTALKSWVKRLLVSGTCIIIIYLLFARLLQVYTPPERFF
ncbi:MAG: tripartite tricarboxylate transporter TctB family protein [Pseudomonadota bacterium]